MNIKNNNIKGKGLLTAISFKGIAGAGLLFSLLVSSCASYKAKFYQKYERPEVTVENNALRDAGTLVNVNDTTNFGDLSWRAVFTDPQLQALIDTALVNNVDLLNAAINVQIAETQVKTARLAFLPSFSFAPTGTLSKVLTGEYKGEWMSTYSLPVNATWNAELFGSLTASKRQAQVQLIASADAQQAVRSRIICGVANLYYSLLMMDRQLEILNDMKGLTEDTYELMKVQKELRGARETAVVSAEASLLSVQSKIVDMESQIRELENSLALLIGKHAQGIKRGKLESQSLPAKFSAGVGVNVLTNRPDVHAAEMQLASCFYGIQQARARMYPSLSITANGAYANNLGSIVSNPGAFLCSFVGNLVQPIFANGKLKAGLQVSELQYQQALNTWQQKILAAGSEVSNAMVQYNSSNAKGSVDRQQVEVLKKNVEYAQDLFKMGSSSYLEVITAQTNLLNAEISVVTDDFNKMQAVVNLYSALGGGRN